MTIDIRLLGAGDGDVLARVAPAVFDHPVDRRWSAEFLGDARHHLAVALDGGTVVGMATGVHYVHPDKAPQLWIDEVGVSPAHRGRGVGTGLVHVLLARARALGCTEAWVLTSPANAAARRMYARAGGVEAAEPAAMFTFPLDDARGPRGDDGADGAAPALRTAIRPGDTGAVAALHGVLYAREYGFDATFEAYVAGPLAAFVLRAAPRERLWLAERAGHLVGSIAIVAEREEAGGSATVAQLRWFLIDPAARGAGLGRRMLEEAVAFARAAGYERIVLWTVSALQSAARLYRAAGFRRVEARAAHRWGVDVVEEQYELPLR